MVTDGNKKSNQDKEVDKQREGVALLVQKVEEYRSALELMDHHDAVTFLREVMQKGSKVRLYRCVCLCIHLDSFVL